MPADSRDMVLARLRRKVDDNHLLPGDLIRDAHDTLAALSASPARGEGDAGHDGIFSPFNACCYRETCRAMARAHPAPATPAGASFLGHLVETYGGEHQFVPAGQPLPLPTDRGKVTPVYDGPQNVTATPAGEELRERVGKIIDPWAFNQCEWASRDDNDEVLREFLPKRDEALAKADAILAALQPQAEGE